MCLVIPKHQSPATAEQDMTVYKVLSVHREAIMYSFYYKENEKYRTPLTTEVIGAAADIVAVTSAKAQFGEDWQHGDRCMFIAGGFHSCLNLDRAIGLADSYERGHVYRCTIPRGSYYYTDQTGLCVSNQIIVHKLASGELSNSEG